MSFFDRLDKVKYNAGRFFWPVLFLIVGIILLRMGLVPEIKQLNNPILVDGELQDTIAVKQNTGFLYASLFFIGASVIWFLYLLGIIKSKAGYLVMAVLGICGALLIYTDYMNIKNTLDFQAAAELRDTDIKARMDDIKQAQLAYKEMNGVYTDSMDDLIDFVKHGEKMKIQKKGSVPERKITVEERDFLYNDDRPIDKLMTEIEAAALSKSSFADTDIELQGFVRDTIFVPVMDAVFLDEKRVEMRNKTAPSLDFHVDSLRYIPHTKDLVRMDTGTVDKSGTKFPTLYIEMGHPMNGQLKDSVIYSIGDKDKKDNTLRESWKDQ